jgi:hypothetical protein
MHEHQVRALLERLIAATDPAAEYEERHQDSLVEFPQSGEQMNRDGLRKLQEHYPGGAPKIHLRQTDRRRRRLVRRVDHQLPRRQDRPRRHPHRVPRRQDVARDPLLGRAVPGPGMALNLRRTHPGARRRLTSYPAARARSSAVKSASASGGRLRAAPSACSVPPQLGLALTVLSG